MTAAAAGERVRPMLDKYFASPHTANHAEPLPLARLYLLDATLLEGASLAPITGATAFDRLPGELYRRRFYGPLSEPIRHFALLSRLARNVSFFSFDRPFTKASFEAGVDAMEAEIRRHD